MITAIIPKLPFIDKNNTVDFYVNRLGFLMNSDFGDYFILSKDTFELHLFSYPTLNPLNSDFMIYILIKNTIENFYNQLQEADVEIHPNGGIETKPWNQIEFSIVDPNGTLLTFGQSI